MQSSEWPDAAPTGPEPSSAENERPAEGIAPFSIGGVTFDCRVRQDGRFVWRAGHRYVGRDGATCFAFVGDRRRGARAAAGRGCSAAVGPALGWVSGDATASRSIGTSNIDERQRRDLAPRAHATQTENLV